MGCNDDAGKGRLSRRLLGLLARPFTRVPAEYRQRFEQARLATNLRRMHALSIYVIVVQILLNLLNILRPSEGQADDIMVYVMLSLGTLAMGVVYCVLLGLAISQSLVRRMGGEITVDSAPGQGSVFCFALELSGAATVPALQARPAGQIRHLTLPAGAC